MANFPIGQSLANTVVMDVTNLEGKDLGSREFKEFIVRLVQNLNNISIAVNNKETSIYALTEYFCGQLYFPDPALTSTTPQSPTDRGVFRTVVNFGALPNAGTKSVAHGIDITAANIFTHIYATATNPGVGFIPIPYASATLINNVEINVDAVNVNITTGVDLTVFTICYVVLEYIR